MNTENQDPSKALSLQIQNHSNPLLYSQPNLKPLWQETSQLAAYTSPQVYY